MSIRIEDLDGQTPIRKEVTKPIILAMKKFRQNGKKITGNELGKIIGTTGGNLSVMTSVSSKSFLRLHYLHKFVLHYQTSIEDFIGSIDQAVGKKDLIETYFNLNQKICIKGERRQTMTARAIAQLNALSDIEKPVTETTQKNTGQNLPENNLSGKYFIPGKVGKENNRRKLISGIYSLFGFRENFQFRKEFGVELESEFLETGLLPSPWQEKIAQKTNLEEFVARFQKVDKLPKKARSSKKQKSFQQPIKKAEENKGREDKQATSAIDTSSQLFKAITSAYLNAGIVKGESLSLEVLIGTLVKRLSPDFLVTLTEGKIIISGEGKEYKISLKGGFPWETK